LNNIGTGGLLQLAFQPVSEPLPVADEEKEII